MVIKTSSSLPTSKSQPQPQSKSSTILTPNSSLYLPGTDFLLSLKPGKRYSKNLIFGEGGSGKTTFALRYAPSPIAMINFDWRAEEAMRAAKELGQVVHPLFLDMPSEKLSVVETKSAAREVVEKVMKNIKGACHLSLTGKVRTILLDTGSELSEIFKLSYDGVTEQTKEGAFGKDKGYVKLLWRRIFRDIKFSKAHLIITARAKEIWIENMPKGKYTYQCPSVINDGVDWAGNIRWARNRVGQLKPEQEIEITKSVIASELGEVYTSKDWEAYGGPFVYGCVKQYGGSLPEDWT